MKRVYIKTQEEVKNSQLQRSDETKAAISSMLENEKYQNDPMVGIFWYSPSRNCLFGVFSSFAEDAPVYYSDQFHCNVKSDRRLHKDIWKRKSRQASNTLFKGDYTRVPRGRVFEFENQGFKVYVGDWIDDYPEAKALILDEFQLPENTEFVKDVHWDIGHGWSDEF